MKRALFITDDSVSLTSLLKRDFSGIDEIDFLPLGGDWTLLRQVQKILETKSQIRLLEGARLLAQEVQTLRQNLPSWTSRVLNESLGIRPLKEFFLVDHQRISAAYFSPISEMNPLKTDLFLHLAQAHLILSVLRKGDYCITIAGIQNVSLKRVLERNLGKLDFLPTQRKGYWVTTIKSRALSSFWGNLLAGSLYLGRSLLRSFQAKRTFRDLSRSAPNPQDLLFVSYFPYFDSEEAKKNRFRNRYALPLQEQLKRESIGIVWLCLFILVDGIPFREALRSARRFVQAGENLFFLEEFLGVRSIAVAFFRWVWNMIRYSVVRQKIFSKPIHEGLTEPACEPLLKELFLLSFCGLPTIQGLLYYAIFYEVARRFHRTKTVLYYSEMQIWETALNAAFHRNGRTLRTIGFQHTCVSPNHFFYFPHPSLMKNESYGYPLPDVLLANGQIPLSLMKKSGYPDLREVESIRYLHVKSHLGESFQKKDLLLVVGSIERKASEALLSLVVEAFPGPQTIEIWLKSHPSCSFQEIARQKNLSVGVYQFKEGAMENCLRQARWVLVTTSAVAIEALAFGCDLLIPFFGHSICMSPILGFEDYYQSIYSPVELREKVLALQGSSVPWEKKREFVENYWCLDPSLIRWKRLLNLRSLEKHNGS